MIITTEAATPDAGVAAVAVIAEAAVVVVVEVWRIFLSLK